MPWNSPSVSRAPSRAIHWISGSRIERNDSRSSTVVPERAVSEASTRICRFPSDIAAKYPARRPGSAQYAPPALPPPEATSAIRTIAGPPRELRPGLAELGADGPCGIRGVRGPLEHLDHA